MSFKKTKNTHDEWVAFREKISDLIKVFINKNLDSMNQNAFEEYLTKGINENFHTPLVELSNENFLLLEKIVNEWESFQIGFDSFYHERVKRFNRYG